MKSFDQWLKENAGIVGMSSNERYPVKSKMVAQNGPHEIPPEDALDAATKEQGSKPECKYLGRCGSKKESNNLPPKT